MLALHGGDLAESLLNTMCCCESSTTKQKKCNSRYAVWFVYSYLLRHLVAPQTCLGTAVGFADPQVGTVMGWCSLNAIQSNIKRIVPCSVLRCVVREECEQTVYPCCV